METYIVIVECCDLPQGGRLYGAFAPDVPGCTATGKTLDEALSQMRANLEAVFRSLRRAGREIPQAHSLEYHKEYFEDADTFFLGANSIVAMIDVQVSYRRLVRAA